MGRRETQEALCEAALQQNGGGFRNLYDTARLPR
jgi:hypothetical protein